MKKERNGTGYGRKRHCSDILCEDTVEDDDIAATSYVNGQFTIPNCIHVLLVLMRQVLFKNDDCFNYALELITYSKNGGIVVSVVN